MGEQTAHAEVHENAGLALRREQPLAVAAWLAEAGALERAAETLRGAGSQQRAVERLDRLDPPARRILGWERRKPSTSGSSGTRRSRPHRYPEKRVRPL